jgi:hypothetical protein
MVLWLHGLEIVNEHTEHLVDHGLTSRAAPGHLPKALAPDGHLPTAMRRDNGPAIDHSRHLVDGENPIMAPRNTCEIGWRGLERRRGGAILAKTGRNASEAAGKE